MELALLSADSNWSLVSRNDPEDHCCLTVVGPLSLNLRVMASSPQAENIYNDEDPESSADPEPTA